MLYPYIYRIFGKEEVNLEDIETYFSSEQEENGILEFKSGDSQIEDMFKEVCAFLNSEGGLLIVGAPRETKKQDKKVCIGALTNCSFNNELWIHQKLNKHINPLPTGINIKEITHNSGKLFLIDVRQSFNPPHQCETDGKYYIRVGSESRFASHGLVKALFEKRKLPQIEIDLTYKRDLVTERINEISIEFKNKNNIPAENIHFLIDLFNIDSVKQNGFYNAESDNLKKLSWQSEFTFPLVPEIRAIVTIQFVTHKKRIIIYPCFWSKDIGFTKCICILDTSTGIADFFEQGDFSVIFSELVSKYNMDEMAWN